MRLHKPGLLFGTDAQIYLSCCEDKRILRHLPEVCVVLRDHTQPRVLELSQTPRVAKRPSLSGEQLFHEGDNSARIEDRERIECDCLDSRPFSVPSADPE
jgi:hypothetical protein